MAFLRQAVFLLGIVVAIKGVTCSIQFANSYSNHMVLQRAPKRAIIWGHASKLGDTVTVTMNGATVGTTTVTTDALGQNVWKLKLPAESSTTPFSITVRSSEGESSIHDVLFGDVWVCSGQSNMQFQMRELEHPDQEIDEAVKFSNIRTFIASMVQSTTLLKDITVKQAWLKPTKGFIDHFSAVCFLYAKALYADRQYPIGLLETNWGGTAIEPWSSPDAAATCSGAPVIGKRKKRVPTANSVLWNAMVYPLIQTTIYGAVWYQGESNAGRPAQYACQFPAMIADWRKKFHTASDGETDDMFPFGFVQLAPYRDVTSIGGMPPLRWAQTANLGYVPNDHMPNTFMSVAIDQPDFASTSGSIHPRFKQAVAARLALGARAVAYGEQGVDFQGPFPTSFIVDTNSHTLTITYDNGAANIDTRVNSGFEICCSQIPGCTNWLPTQIISHQTSTVTLSTAMCPVGTSPKTVRYIWRESPCALNSCAIYDQGSSLPAPPFIHTL